MLIQTTESKTGIQVELMPLIDMVFLLLIFFLVATTFRQEEREMKVSLPYAESSGPISAALKDMIVNVTKEGSIIVGGQELEDDAFRDMITESVERNSNQKVTIRGDRDASYSAIVRVLDICKASGIQEPYLDTVLTP